MNGCITVASGWGAAEEGGRVESHPRALTGKASSSGMKTCFSLPAAGFNEAERTGKETKTCVIVNMSLVTHMHRQAHTCSN